MTDLTQLSGALAELKDAARAIPALAKRVSDLDEKLQDTQDNMATYYAKRSDVINGTLTGLAAAAGGAQRAVPGSRQADPSVEPVLEVSRRAVADFVRKGDPGFEEKGLDATTAANGQVTLPRMLADQIIRTVFDTSPLARLARRVTIDSGSQFDQPVITTLPGAEWVSDTGARSTQASPNFALASIPLTELSSIVPVTQRLLDDSAYDIGGMVQEVISAKFGQAAGKAFVTGTGAGANQPTGLLTYTTASTSDASRAWFTLQHVPTTAAGAFGTSPIDNLIDLIYSLKAGFRQNARWLMNRKTASVVRKLKDSTGQLIWSDGLIAGQPSSLLGFPVELDEEMPDIAANSLSIAFGDIASAYTVVARSDMGMLRDPYTLKGSVLFYATLRIGGGLVNSEAVKLLKFAVS